MPLTSKTTIILTITLLFLLGAGCSQKNQPETTTTTPTSTAQVVKKQPVQPVNPAGEFCKSEGNELIIRFDPTTQSSKSFCRFANTTECDADAYYAGKCTPGQGAQTYQNPTEEINIFTACGTEFEPVCGQNGTTYTNKCLALIQGIIISHNGACIDNDSVSASVILNTPSKLEDEEEPFSDLPPTVDTSMPGWLGVVKDFILSSPPNNPQSFIEKCTRDNKIYYFQSDGCADCFSILYDSDGNTVCYPTSDLNNECPPSFNIKNRFSCTKIWKDER